MTASSAARAAVDDDGAAYCSTRLLITVLTIGKTRCNDD